MQLGCCCRKQEKHIPVFATGKLIGQFLNVRMIYLESILQKRLMSHYFYHVKNEKIYNALQVENHLDLCFFSLKSAGTLKM